MALLSAPGQHTDSLSPSLPPSASPPAGDKLTESSCRLFQRRGGRLAAQGSRFAFFLPPPPRQSSFPGLRRQRCRCSCCCCCTAPSVPSTEEPHRRTPATAHRRTDRHVAEVRRSLSGGLKCTFFLEICTVHPHRPPSLPCDYSQFFLTGLSSCCRRCCSCLG